jgi:DNA-directed RNA polymerase subunit RPC12/RpoP
MPPEMKYVGDCENCGSSLMHETEEMFDGTSLVCPHCSCVHWWSCDQDGGYINTENEFESEINNNKGE